MGDNSYNLNKMKEFTLNGASACVNHTSSWTCSLCDGNNNPESEECGVCGAPIQMAKQGPPPGAIPKRPRTQEEVRRQATTDGTDNSFQGWLCEQCIVVNSNFATKCANCKVLRPPAGWKCKVCTLENEPERTECERCSRPKDNHVPKEEVMFWKDEKVSKPQVEDEKGWTCEACSLINLPARPGCEACGTSRPRDYVVSVEDLVKWEEKAMDKETAFQKENVSKPKVGDEKGWTCEVCSLINSPARPGCDACGKSRPLDYTVSVEDLVKWEEKATEKETAFLKENVSKPKVGDEKGWTCEFCSLINSPARRVCKVCNNAKQRDYAMSANKVVNWQEKTNEKEAVYRKEHGAKPQTKKKDKSCSIS